MCLPFPSQIILLLSKKTDSTFYSSCVISFVRLLSVVTWIRVGDSDITYTLQPIVAWSYVSSPFPSFSLNPKLTTQPLHREIELAACILCANAPCLRPFFTTHLPFLSLSAHTHASSNDKTNPPAGGNNFPTTIGGKRSRAVSPCDEIDGIFDGTQDIELENYDIEMQQQTSPQQQSYPNTPMHTKKHSYAKHGYKPSTGNVTIVSVSLQHGGSRSGSRRSSFSYSSEEGKSVSRQQSLRSVGEERRGRRGQNEGQRGRENEDEGGIVVQTSYHVQTVREDV
jgi:hypothetical protein